MNVFTPNTIIALHWCHLRSIRTLRSYALIPQDWCDTWVTEHELPAFLSWGPKMLMAVSISVLDEVYTRVAIWLNDQGKSKITLAEKREQRAIL